VSKLLLFGGLCHFEPQFQGEGVVPRKYFLVSRKLDTFCYLTVKTAPCYVQSFWHNTSVWQTDRQTDGIAIASTALAMRALWRAVKTLTWGHINWFSSIFSFRDCELVLWPWALNLI